MANRMTKEQARQFLTHYHYLQSTDALQETEGVLTYFARVGSIQFDPLNVVGRNPDLVLQARIQGYQAKQLHALLYETHQLMDGLDKMLCIYQAQEFERFRHIREMQKVTATNYLTYRNQMGMFGILNDVRDYIRVNGPTQAAQLDIKGEERVSKWGHSKLSSVALDYLYQCGELCVVGKRGTQKIYDLHDRVHDSAIQLPGFDEKEAFLDWYIKRRIGSIGLLWSKNDGGWLGLCVGDANMRKKAIASLLAKQEIAEYEVEGIKYPFYMRKEDQGILQEHSAAHRVSFLAPLDNLLWDRGMVQALFDFSYRWEVYVPKHKRRFGYYVLPVLYGTRFIARMEPEMFRGGVLQIKHWWWEDGIEPNDAMMHAIHEAFSAFCRYLQADSYICTFTATACEDETCEVCHDK